MWATHTENPERNRQTLVEAQSQISGRNIAKQGNVAGH